MQKKPTIYPQRPCCPSQCLLPQTVMPWSLQTALKQCLEVPKRPKEELLPAPRRTEGPGHEGDCSSGGLGMPSFRRVARCMGNPSTHQWRDMRHCSLLPPPRCQWANSLARRAAPSSLASNLLRVAKWFKGFRCFATAAILDLAFKVDRTAPPPPLYDRL